jgi:hypothetical protein
MSNSLQLKSKSEQWLLDLIIINLDIIPVLPDNLIKIRYKIDEDKKSKEKIKFYIFKGQVPIGNFEFEPYSWCRLSGTDNKLESIKLIHRPPKN